MIRAIILFFFFLPIMLLAQAEWTIDFTIEKPDSSVFARGFGIADGATDGYDILSDLPLFIGSSDTNAFFPVSAPFISALSYDIRSNRVGRHRWDMVFRYMPASLVEWLPDSIPAEGSFEISTHLPDSEPSTWLDMRFVPSVVVPVGFTVSFKWSIPSSDDSIPPVISTWSPIDGAIDVPRETNISCEIHDYESGVYRSSIQMVVNGINVTWLLAIDSISTGFSVTYSPIIPFGWETSVTVIVSAMDNATPGNFIADTVRWITIDDSLAFTVTGTVGTGEPMIPISGAIVTISGKTDTTDAAGSFSFDSISEGAYTLRAQATGYQQRTLFVYIDSDTSFIISLVPLSPPDILVIDYDSGSNPFDDDTLGEEDVIASMLNFLGYDFVLTEQNPDLDTMSLNGYRYIILITPVRSASLHSVLSDSEVSLLISWLSSGGRLLWIAPDAGSDYYNGTLVARSFFDMFGALYESDGRPFSPTGNVGWLIGSSSDFFLDTHAEYSLGSRADNYIDEFSPSLATSRIALASQDSAPAPIASNGRMVFNDNMSYRTVISSVLFGGIIDGIFPNTKNNLFSGCMRFLEGSAEICDGTQKPSFSHLKIFPNPFNASCKIECDYSVEIFDVSGRLVDVVYAKRGVAFWDGSDRENKPRPSGVYYAKETSSSRSAKIVLMR